jgi:hypothetical protein
VPVELRQRGCAARVAGPECTDVLEDRKRRPDHHGQRPGRVGAGELCSPKPVAGGAEPFQGSAVYRRPSSPRRFEASLH